MPTCFARLPIVIAVVAGLVGGCGEASGGHLRSEFAPYVDVSLASNALDALVRESGAPRLRLAFVIAPGRRCEAAWGGGAPITSRSVRHLAASTQVTVSFGGQAGPDLATSCATAATLAHQYERVIAALHASRADFDIEGSSLWDQAVTRRRSRAIAALQARARASRRPVAVSLTLPVEPSGLPGRSLAVVRSALASGVRVGLVNVLAMDYGSSKPALKPGTMSRYAIASAIAAKRQLQRLLPALAPRRIWHMIGITTMIGRNDVASEIFTTTDARQLLRFARGRNLGSLSFWSLARDRSCPDSRATRRMAQDDCSGVPQAPFEFTHLFARFAG